MATWQVAHSDDCEFAVHRNGCRDVGSGREDSYIITGDTVDDAIASDLAEYNAQGQTFTLADYGLWPCVESVPCIVSETIPAYTTCDKCSRRTTYRPSDGQYGCGLCGHAQPVKDAECAPCIVSDTVALWECPCRECRIIDRAATTPEA